MAVQKKAMRKEKLRGPYFSERTLSFIQTAGRQKSPTWLDRNRATYEEVLQQPLQSFAQTLQTRLKAEAIGYHFPRKGLGRIKRTARSISESGALYKDWITYSASCPAQSRFERNPSLFFLLDPNDDDGDRVLVAGGLYMPSSRQLRAVREEIARDSSSFKKLFASKPFAKRFPGGFSDERKAKRMPRGFDPAHPDAEWIKYQGYFVWRSYSVKEFSSARFAELVADDFMQILHLNRLLDQATGRVQCLSPGLKTEIESLPLENRFPEVTAPKRTMDF